ncbi:hypothetical protein Dimus_027399 [Dionaea muscipula]
MEAAFNTSITCPIPYTYSIITSSSSSTTRSRCDVDPISNNIITLPTSTMATPTSCSDGSPWMDSRIWSRLPQRLVDRVLAFLPPPAFFRARCVCKRWYALLYSNAFLQLYLQISPRRHCFLFFITHKIRIMTQKSHNIHRNMTNGGAAAAAAAASYDNIVYSHQYSAADEQQQQQQQAYLFDPYEIAWYRLSLPLVPPGFSPCSTSGGLICWVSDDAGPKTLFLHNPLQLVAGSLTQLAPTLRPRLFPSIGLSISDTSIDIVVAGDDLISPYAVKNLTAESFHIDAGGFYSIWGTSSALPRLCSLESGHMTHHNGRFYCMSYSPFSVLTYDISSNNWWKLQAPMRRFLRSPSLVELEGKLMLVAAVEKSKLNVPRSLRVWCLQACGTAWVEVERMPQQLYSHFAEVEGGRGFDCIGHGEFVLIMVRGGGGGGGGGGPAGGMNQLGVVFDMRRKRWMWMPPCPFVHEMQMQGFGFEPRLATPVTALLDHLALPFQSSFIA